MKMLRVERSLAVYCAGPTAAPPEGNDERRASPIKILAPTTQSIKSLITWIYIKKKSLKI